MANQQPPVSFFQTRSPQHSVELISKIESSDCLPNLDDIIEASDSVMVARGDLGAQIPVEDVPSVQKYVVTRARQLGKPSIVAAQLLQSMIEYPIPTRAEVSGVPSSTCFNWCMYWCACPIAKLAISSPVLKIEMCRCLVTAAKPHANSAMLKYAFASLDSG